MLMPRLTTAEFVLSNLTAAERVSGERRAGEETIRADPDREGRPSLGL